MNPQTPCYRFVEQLQHRLDERQDLSSLLAHPHLVSCDRCQQRLNSARMIDQGLTEPVPIRAISPDFLASLHLQLGELSIGDGVCVTPTKHQSTRTTSATRTQIIAWTSACLIIGSILFFRKEGSTPNLSQAFVEVAMKSESPQIVLSKESILQSQKVVAESIKEVRITAELIDVEMLTSFRWDPVGIIHQNAINALEPASDSLREAIRSIGDYSPSLKSKWF
jgi:hypothetical protein